MTPEQLQQLNDLIAWKAARESQQISNPLDETSRRLLRVVSTSGQGSTTKTQTVSVPSTPTNITVPAAYVGSLIVETPDGRFEIPYIKAL